jgi:hypothetical protein
MSVKLGNSTKMTTRVRSLFVSTLVLGVHLALSLAQGHRQSRRQPLLTRSRHQRETLHFWWVMLWELKVMFACPQAQALLPLFLDRHASRPEATLYLKVFDRFEEVVTHFLSPDTNPNTSAPNPLPFGSATWQSSFDSSKVWGQPLQTMPAGSDQSCPNAGAIACLLLQSIGSEV